GAEPRLDVVEPTLAKTIGTVGAVGLRRRGRCAGNNGDVVQGSSLRWQELGERRGVSPTWGPRYARRAYASTLAKLHVRHSRTTDNVDDACASHKNGFVN